MEFLWANAYTFNGSLQSFPIKMLPVKSSTINYYIFSINIYAFFLQQQRMPNKRKKKFLFLLNFTGNRNCIYIFHLQETFSVASCFPLIAFIFDLIIDHNESWIRNWEFEKLFKTFGHWHESRIKHSHAAFIYYSFFPRLIWKWNVHITLGLLNFHTYSLTLPIKLYDYCHIFCVNIISFLKIYVRMLCLHILCIGFKSRD